MSDEQQETVEVDPDHPWVEAATLSAPRPVEVYGKIDAFVLSANENSMDVGLMTFITPVGVFNFYMGPRQLGEFTMQCAEVMDQITAGTEQQPGIVIANNAQMKEEAKRADAARNLRLT